MQLEIDSSSIQSLESTLGMFPCQLLLGYQHFLSNCMASSYICTFKADRSCRAQLLMEHSYPFSHYCLLYVRSTRPEDNHRGLACVCVHSVANNGNRPGPWKHLFNSLNRYVNANKGLLPYNTPDVIRFECKHNSLRKMKFAQTCAECQSSHA